MTIPNSNYKNNYVGNGVADTFAYTFKILESNDLNVIQSDLDGIETPVMSYTVTGVGETGGGNVVLAAPLTDGYKLAIVRSPTDDQTVDLRNQGAVFRDVIEDALDQRTMVSLKQQEELDRSIKIPTTDVAGASLTLPSAADRALKTLAFDASGNVIAGEAPTGGIVSLAMTPVVQASSLALARAAIDPNQGDWLVKSNGASAARSLTDRASDVFNVKDYGAAGDGVTNDSTAIESALTAMGANGGILFFPPGNYLITRAIRLGLQAVTVIGSGIRSTTITRTSTALETIDAQSFATIFYVTGGWNNIENLTIIGNGGASTVDGITFGVNIAAKGYYRQINISACRYGITEVAGVFMSVFSNIVCVSCGAGIQMVSSVEKTSNNFNSCYMANCGPAFLFNKLVYSTLSGCAADNCNWGATGGNPYGTGYGSPNSSTGVYHFALSNVTLNGCGTEGSYGNGSVSCSQSTVSINNFESIGGLSTFQPDYGSYSTYAVGPVQTGDSFCCLNINGFQVTNWHNTYVDGLGSKPVAALVAFNFDTILYGAYNFCMVNVGSINLPVTNMILGYGDRSRYCRSAYQLCAAPAFAAYQSAPQGLTTATFTKLTIDTEEFDTFANYDAATNRRFMPTVPGYYQINGASAFSGTVTNAFVCVYKNGALFKLGSNVVGTLGASTVSTLVYLNGSTDYVELWAYATGTGLATTASATYTYFQGSPTKLTL